jgi:D-serine deaminase-like pyridoxal phosphate-dependent protein
MKTFMSMFALTLVLELDLLKLRSNARRMAAHGMRRPSTARANIKTLALAE